MTHAKAPTYKLADYHQKEDAEDLICTLQAYALDPMGGGQGLSDFAIDNLTSTLATLPYAFSILMYVDGKIAGLANCLEGFSSFACKKLINIHDFVILPEFRGQKLSQGLLNAVETEAKKRGCCKLTLEVLEGNKVAHHAYLKFGFKSYELNPSTGRALFLQKPF